MATSSALAFRIIQPNDNGNVDVKCVKSNWSMKYRSRSPGQGTCQISTSRKSTMQDMVILGLIIEELSNIKYRSRYLPSQYNEVKHYARLSCCRSYIWGDIEHQCKMCQRHWSAKYRSRSPGQGTCQFSTSRKSTIQGLVAEGLIAEDIWKGDVKCVKVNGARNIGQGHQKLPAESVQWGEVQCKVWWL